MSAAFVGISLLVFSDGPYFTDRINLETDLIMRKPVIRQSPCSCEAHDRARVHTIFKQN